MINDILRHIKNIEIRKIGEDDVSVSYIIIYNNEKAGMLTINKKYIGVIQRIQQLIALFK